MNSYAYRKFIAIGLVVAMAIFQLGLATPAVVLADSQPNLVANPSMELATAGVPDGWLNNAWADPAGSMVSSFEYDTQSANSQDGVASLKTTISSYGVDGDAKWFFTPVAVTPGMTYRYSDFYKSSAPTSLVIAYWNGYTPDTDATIYDSLPDAPASPDAWTQYSGEFSVPAEVTHVSIYHLLNRVGMLSIDNVSLSQKVAKPLTFDDILLNPSFEDSTTGWNLSSWMEPEGAFTATPEWVEGDGHDGTRSVKVTISGYDREYTPGTVEDQTQGGTLSGDVGDAKWSLINAMPVGGVSPLQIGQQYRFTVWYKASSGLTPKVVADYVAPDGTETFFGMPNALPSANSDSEWTKYSDTFSIPQGVTSLMLFMFIDENGWLQTDDYSIESYTPTGWNEPLLTLSFDDGSEDNIDTLLPLLETYGFKSTQCYETGTILANPEQIKSNVLPFFDAGNEVCSHTITHPMLSYLNDAQLAQELQDSKSTLESWIGQPVTNLASPYGDYNQTVLDALQAAGYVAHRTTDEGYNSKDNFNPYRLRVQNIFYGDGTAGIHTTTAEQVAAWVAQAQADKTWLILVYHRVVDTDNPNVEAPGPYDTTLDIITEHFEAIKASHIAVKTMHDALADVTAQLETQPTPTPTPTVTPSPTPTPTVTPTLTPNITPGDLNNDNVVDALDLSTLLTNWGKNGMTAAQGDINNDDTVDALDLSTLLTNWSK